MRHLLALALAGLLGCAGGAASRGGHGGRPVALSLPALEGGYVDVAAYHGRVVVLHLFATGSVPAQLDVAQLQAAQDGYRGKLQVIGIAFDPDGYHLVAAWRRAFEVRYLLALAPPGLAAGESELGRIASVPTTVVLDGRGVEVARRERALGPGELARILAPMLGSPEPTAR